MRWLFLTDFHFGKADSSSRENAIQELLKLLRLECIDTIEVVVLGGDLAYSGIAEEYAPFSEFVSELRKIPALARAQLLAVPGNHDLDCDCVDPLTWDGLGSSRQQKYMDETSAGASARRARAQGFRAFEEFAAATSIYAPRPSREITRHWSKGRSPAVHFVLTNTALFANKERDVPSDGHLPAPLSSLRSILGTIKPEPGGVTFVVGHHPIDSFKADQQGPLRALLDEHHAVYIHGHTHRPAAEHGPLGLRSLGFGAAYQASPDAAAVPFYSNSAAFCLIEDGTLKIRLMHWDCENGRWAATSKTPPDFVPEEGVPSGRYRLQLPSKKRGKPEHLGFRHPPRHGPARDTLVMLGADASSLLAIDALQTILGVFPRDAARKITESPGRMVIQYSTAAGPVRVSVMTASGQLLTRDDVEDANTTIDYEGLARCCILTTGSISPDARISYDRLRERKPLLILDQTDIGEAVYKTLSASVRVQLENLDSAAVRLDILIAPAEVFVCVQDAARPTWFYLLDHNGGIVPEGHVAVRSLRDLRPSLLNAHYGTPDSGHPQVNGPTVAPFDRREYLKRAYEEFNQVRYAALAFTGVRFSAITLEELYVAASAIDGSPDAAAVAKAADDALQSLGLPEEFRSQMEAQMKRMLRGNLKQETGAARRLYQRYGMVLVLGDPGSGKTCFVKHEMLAYCKEQPDDAWYGQHLPVYVQLSELTQVMAAAPAAKLTDWISALCLRRGLELPSETLVELAASGKVAFFFDGFDEVPSLDARDRVFTELGNAVAAAGASGNRIVITSRPAALHLVEVPEGLRTVALKGLSTSEMRILARRVLAARVVDEGIDVPLDDTPLEGGDTALIDKIVQDCDRTPGLRRLAQNPLLFTLLIMIYAVSGAPAAKRHRVYQQAVQTLATVRSRTTGQRAFSEADLRRRLGAIALFVFRDASAALPAWKEAVRVLRGVVAAERDVSVDAVGTREAEAFLQSVAEETGLVVPRRTGDLSDGSFFTFMHQSFLEYYAAVGLLLDPAPVELASQLSGIPRWKEVLLLFAGILADQQDVTPLIARLLRSNSRLDAITLQSLELAIECALESEIPSETAQSQILRALAEWGVPALRHDADLRIKFGRLLERLYATGRSQHVLVFLESGMAHERMSLAGVYAELTGVVFAEFESVPASTMGRFEALCSARGDSLLLASLCEALASCRSLRNDRTIPVIALAMRRSAAAKYAAIRACERAPQLASGVWEELRENIRTGRPYVAVSSASAILRARWRVEPSDTQARSEMTRALQCLLQFGREDHVTLLQSSVELTSVESMLVAAESETRLLGVCLLPWVRNASREVYGRLIQLVTSAETERSIRVAALGGLQISPELRQLLKISDLDKIYSLLEAPTRDVRMAAARLIGHARPEAASEEKLKAYVEHSQDDAEEFRAALRSLGGVGADLSSLHKYIELQISKRLKAGTRQTPSWRRELLEFFQLALQSNKLASSAFAARLRTCVEDPKLPGDVRGAAMVCLGWLGEPSVESADFLIQLARSSKQELHAARADALWRFVTRCSRRVAYVRAVRSRLDALIEAAVHLASQTPSSEHGPADLSRIRQSLTEILRIRSAYEEYASRSSPK